MSAKQPRRAVRTRIYPFEAVAWAGLGIGVAFLRFRGIPLSWSWSAVVSTLPPLVAQNTTALLIGLLLFAVYRLVARRSLPAYLRRVGSGGWLLLWGRLWLASLVFPIAYGWLKVMVPLVNWNSWDYELWRVDAFLHAGFQPSLLLPRWLQGTGILPWLDLWYSWWLVTAVGGLAFFCAHPLARVRRQVMLSYVLIWTLGSWLYTALPAQGPVYVFGEAWSGMHQEMPRARAIQELLRRNYETMLAGRRGHLRPFMPTLGVAAMPSLHVGIHWLLMLWARRHARLLFWPAAVATGLTLVGSVATGWHYAVDGYVGILLAQLCYGMARRWERP